MGLILKNGDKVFLDTSPFIYFFERHPEYLPKMKTLFEQIYNSDAQIITSIITYIELTTHPAKLNKPELVKKYRDYLTNSENIILLPLDITIADITVQIRAKYNFKTPDAIQVATAINCQADYLISNDKKWRKIEEVKILLLDDL